MAQPQKIEIQFDAPAAPDQRPAPPAGPSPAFQLQQLLVERHGAATAPEEDRWSPRRTLMLVVASCSAMWLAIIVAARAAITAIA